MYDSARGGNIIFIKYQMQIERLHASKEYTYTCQVVCQRNDIVNLAPQYRCNHIWEEKLCLCEKKLHWIITVLKKKKITLHLKYFLQSTYFFLILIQSYVRYYDFDRRILLLFFLIFYLIKTFCSVRIFSLSPPSKKQERGARNFIII